MLNRGARLIVGDLSAVQPDLVKSLRNDGIEVRDYVPYAELARIYNDSSTVYVPCELQSGGERALIEAMSCGCAVEIAEDNPKLASLLAIRNGDQYEHAKALLDGFSDVMAGRRIGGQVKRAAQRQARREAASDKLRRAPSTIRIRSRHLAHWIH